MSWLQTAVAAAPEQVVSMVHHLLGVPLAQIVQLQ